MIASIDSFVALMIITNVLSILACLFGAVVFIMKFVSRFAILESRVSDVWHFFINSKEEYKPGNVFKSK